MKEGFEDGNKSLQMERNVIKLENKWRVLFSSSSFHRNFDFCWIRVEHRLGSIVNNYDGV